MFDYDRLALDISLMGIRAASQPPSLPSSKEFSMTDVSFSSLSGDQNLINSPHHTSFSAVTSKHGLVSSPHHTSCSPLTSLREVNDSSASQCLDAAFHDMFLSPNATSVPRRCSLNGLDSSATASRQIPISESSIFDCGSSSGYGSPGGTPLASPQNAASYLPAHIQRAFRCEDIGICEDVRTHLGCSLGDSSKGWPTVEETVKKKEEAAVLALSDGFSSDEIADFEQLLCSPKKPPPTKYQCHICFQSGHYISDCPLRFNSPYDEKTPYQGRKKCYGEFQCQQCKRKWTSQNSVANEAQSCIKCHIPVFPHKQLPVEKALAMGYIKQARIMPSKLAPIGHGRPPHSATPVAQ